MIIDNILTAFDNFIILLNENKTVLLLILILLGIYLIYFNKNIIENNIYIINNDVFKIIIFTMTTYIFTLNTTIGISLVIIMIISMQFITNNKFKKEYNI